MEQSEESLRGSDPEAEAASVSQGEEEWDEDADALRLEQELAEIEEYETEKNGKSIFGSESQDETLESAGSSPREAVGTPGKNLLFCPTVKRRNLI